MVQGWRLLAGTLAVISSKTGHATPLSGLSSAHAEPLGSPAVASESMALLTHGSGNQYAVARENMANFGSAVTRAEPTSWTCASYGDAHNINHDMWLLIDNDPVMSIQGWVEAGTMYCQEANRRWFVARCTSFGVSGCSNYSESLIPATPPPGGTSVPFKINRSGGGTGYEIFIQGAFRASYAMPVGSEWNWADTGIEVQGNNVHSGVMPWTSEDNLTGLHTYGGSWTGWNIDSCIDDEPYTYGYRAANDNFKHLLRQAFGNTCA